MAPLLLACTGGIASSSLNLPCDSVSGIFLMKIDNIYRSFPMTSRLAIFSLILIVFSNCAKNTDTTIEDIASSGKLGSTPQSISAGSVSYPLLSGIKIKETAADYKIVVLDYKKLLSLANKNEILVEQGKVYDPVSSGPYQNYQSSNQKIICDVTTEEPNSQKSELNSNPSPESNTVLSVMDYYETVVDDEPGRRIQFLELSFNEANFKIHCTKEEPETDYTWSELQYTFSKIIEVKKIETGATISSDSTNKDSF
jgi:hypothetical protein